MGLFSKDIQTMDDLFLHTLQDIYYAENRIVKSLPDMIDNAGNEELKRGLTAHLREEARPDGSSPRDGRTRSAAGTGVRSDRPIAPIRQLPGHRWHHRGSR